MECEKINVFLIKYMDYENIKKYIQWIFGPLISLNVRKIYSLF